MEIKVKFSSMDSFGGGKTRTFKTLKGAQKFAHEMVGAHPEISETFQYAVGMYGDTKIEVRGDATLKQVFPERVSESVSNYEYED